VALLVLLYPPQVGVPGARQVRLGDGLLDRPRAHPLLPVGVVAVSPLQGDRAAEREAVAPPGGDLGGVALDPHTTAASMSELAAGHVAVDVLWSQREAGRE